ncbi:hypothetical protein OG455_29740 [Kitasatospora sp. NBC_01287]|uniref:hypothetical protein n=1 Tax=Kitasatospora sp. NBC_01287 TaxID=2903573 RepID=UPI00225A35BE|nr:hypothetical protein [Kitasatospora sp. NBC_01287]MCX4749647.1 hypothetical protein [Kitasatospora sp. NBC_01287]
MPSSSVEPAQEREQREAAEHAIAAMVDALALAGLPPLVGLEGARITITTAGAHIAIGGCGTPALQAIADHIAAHARCTGRILRGSVVPTGLAELPGLRIELRHP